MKSNVAIKVQNLSKIYKLYQEPMDRLKEALNPFKKSYHVDFHAVKNVDLEVKRGETVGIIGRNGSGKSTLLKIITGVLTPSSGRVTVRGRISAILELGAGFNPEMSGLENIYLSNSINGMSKKDTDKKIDEIIEFAELGEFIYQPLKTYSSGMKARLAFAVAINIDPDILIVDEALAVGDAAFQRKCFARMEQIREAGATILFVSHSEASIVSLCNRAVWLSNGEKIIEGEPKLVTGLYMKNANKKVIDKKEIEKEFVELKEKTDEKKNSTDTVKEIKGVESSSKPTTRPSEATTPQERGQNSKSTSLEEFYDPSLKPKSTIYYDEDGARISDVKITTIEGRRVNVLMHGKEYIYSYKVEILKPIEDVRFGFLIKNKMGVSLAGGSYSMMENENIKILSKNDYIVKFRFKCIFSEGEYFVNAGCSSFRKHRHRIIDAYTFRVMNIDRKIFTAVVNCINDCKVVKSD